MRDLIDHIKQLQLDRDAVESRLSEVAHVEKGEVGCWPRNGTDTRYVQFYRTYTTPPQVFLSVRYLEGFDKREAPYWTIYTSPVTTSHFNITCASVQGADIFSLHVYWMSFMGLPA